MKIALLGLTGAALVIVGIVLPLLAGMAHGVNLIDADLGRVLAGGLSSIVLGIIMFIVAMSLEQSRDKHHW